MANHNTQSHQRQVAASIAVAIFLLSFLFLCSPLPPVQAQLPEFDLPKLPGPYEVLYEYIPSPYHKFINATFDFMRWIDMKGIRNHTLSNPVAGQPTLKSAKNVDKNILVHARGYDRIALVDYNTRKFGFQTAPNNFTVVSADIMSNIGPNFLYLQGVAAFSMFGIVGVLFTLLFCCCVCLTNCWSRCCFFFCCCRGTFKERDEAFRDDDFKGWKKSRKRKTCVRRVFQILVIIWVVVSVILMMVYSIFAYQLNLDVSESLNDLIGFGDRVQAMGDSVIDTVIGIEQMSTDLTGKVHAFTTKAGNIIPNNTEIENTKNCLNDAFDDMPSPERMSGTVDNTFDHITIEMGVSRTLPESIDGVMDNLRSLESSDLPQIKNTAEEVKTMIGYRSTIAGTPASDLNAKKGNLEGKPSLDDVKTNAIIVKAYTEGNSGGAADKQISEIHSDMIKISNRETTSKTVGELKALLNNFYSAMVELKGGKWSAFKMALDDWKSNWISEDVEAKLDEWKKQFEGVDAVVSLTAFDEKMDDSISGYDSRRDETIQSMKSVDNDLTELRIAAGSIPSLSPIQDELDKKEAVLSLKACLSSVNDTINNIDNNLLLVPDSIKGMINQITDIEQFFGAMDFSGLTTLIEEMDKIKDEFVPAIEQFQEEADLSNNAEDLPKSDPLRELNAEARGVINDGVMELETDSTCGVQCLKWTGENEARATIKAMIEAFGQLDPRNYEGYVSRLDTAINNFDINTIHNMEMVLNTPNPANPCNAETCDGNIADAAESLMEALTEKDLVGALNEYDANAFEDAAMRIQEPGGVDETGTVTHLQDMMDLLENTFVEADARMDGFAIIVDETVDALGTINADMENVMDGLKDAIEGLNSALDEMGDKSDIQAQLDEMSEQMEELSHQAISKIFDNLSSAMVGFDLTEVFGSVDTMMDNFKSLLDAIVGYRSSIQEWKIFALDMVYTADGWRVFICSFIVVLFTVPLPLFALCAVCCTRKPCALMCLATFYVIVAFFCFTTMALFIPYNVLMEDNCPTFEKLSIDAMLTFSPELADAKISQKISLGSGEPIDLEFSLIESADYYLIDCAGDDVIKNVLDTVRVAVNQQVGEVFSIVQDATLPDGFAIHPKVHSFLEDIQGDITGAVNLVSSVSDVFACPAINSIYKGLKGLPCQTYQYLAINIWVMSVILGVFLLASSCFLNFAYCAFICTWTDPRKSSRIEEDMDHGRRSRKKTVGIEMREMSPILIQIDR